MSTSTPLNELLTLKTPADEVETSPDDGMDREPGDIVEAPQVAAQTPAATEPTTQQQPAPAATTPDPASPADDGTSTQGLPKAFHARVKAADERKRAAEERASNFERQFQTVNSRAQELERRAAELEKLNREWQDWYEDQTGRPVPGAQQPAKPQQQQPDISVTLAERDYKIRADFGYRLSVKDNGKETTDQAAQWAQDRAAADRNFYQQIISAPDPVSFAVEEFRKAQVQDELAQYGYDLDKLVAARAGKTTPQTQPLTQQPSPASAHPAARQPAQSMPSDFASQPSGGGRAEPAFAGPRPLGELLKIKR